MPKIDKKIINRRKSELKTIRDKLNKNYLILMLNSSQEVIFETMVNGLSVGYSQYYVRIYVETNKKHANTENGKFVFNN